MARNSTLTNLVDMLRDEIAASSDPSVGQSERALLENQINRAYEFYHGDYDWPHLRVRSDVLTAAGQRYYDFPADIDFDRVESIDTNHGGTWQPVVRGIENDHYDVFDSDNDERTDPVLRWDVIDTGSGPQMELWPIPATDNIKVRVTGFKNFTRLVSGSDRAVIDDMLIVLASAAKLLARYRLPDAEEAIAAAGRRYAILKARSTRRKNEHPNFAGSSSVSSRRPRSIIAVHKED